MDAMTPESERGRSTAQSRGGAEGLAPYPVQCGLCGALLGDVEQHFAWHQDLTAATGMPAS